MRTTFHWCCGDQTRAVELYASLLLVAVNAHGVDLHVTTNGPFLETQSLFAAVSAIARRNGNNFEHQAVPEEYSLANMHANFVRDRTSGLCVFMDDDFMLTATSVKILSSLDPSVFASPGLTTAVYSLIDIENKREYSDWTDTVFPLSEYEKLPIIDRVHAQCRDYENILPTKVIPFDSRDFLLSNSQIADRVCLNKANGCRIMEIANIHNTPEVLRAWSIWPKGLRGCDTYTLLSSEKTVFISGTVNFHTDPTVSNLGTVWSKYTPFEKFMRDGHLDQQRFYSFLQDQQ